MNVLIVGGTRFQGRYLVDELIKKAHRVTIFHTGNHSLDPRIDVTEVLGDRNDPDHLRRLRNSEYDACIDTCAYFPEQVAHLGTVLRTPKYCLISSVYAYKEQYTHLTERSELAQISGNSNGPLTPENYGALKALCEQQARTCFGPESLIVRPCIIIGPGDHTERMSFWVRMAAEKRKLVAPGNLARTVQFVDVRDLTEFTVKCVTCGRSGAINVAGRRYSFHEFLDGLAKLSRGHCQIEKMAWSDFHRLKLDDLPYCYPENSEDYVCDLARSWGFQDRDLECSLFDICEYDRKRGYPINKFQLLEQKMLALFS